MERDSQIFSEDQVINVLIKSNIRISSNISTHVMVFCPFHDNFNSASAEVDKRTGMFYCFSCLYTCDLISLVEMSGLTYFQARRLIGECEYDIVEELDRIFDDNNNNQPCSFDQRIVDTLHANVDGIGRQYFYSRFINDLSISKFKLGYSEIEKMVTVPIHSPTGELWGIVGRSILGKKFKNTPKLQKSKTLFNLHNVWTSPKVFVVESTFDAIRLDQVGTPAVATLGSGLSDEQIDLLQRTFDDIVVIPDNDDAGKVMVAKMMKKIPYVIILPIEGGNKDVGDLTDDQIRGML